jgi:putative PIN family toxin of toxin-antitoxin system
VRVVFDTNILVSALVFPGGIGDAALLRIVEEKDELLLSKPILDGLLGVLARKFARDGEELARIALLLDSLGTRVKPRVRVDVLDDEPDNRILECALAGKADAIVTGDKRLLALKAFRGIPVMTLREFIER